MSGGEELYLKALGWWRKASPDYRIALLEEFGIGFSYNSGAIENPDITYHDTREVFNHDGVSSYTGDLRTLFEIANLKAAWNTIAEKAWSYEPVDEKEILDLHATLTLGTYDEARWSKGERPGAYKLGEYGVGVDAEIGCAAKDAQRLVRELVGNMDEYIEEGMGPGDELQLAAYAHAALVGIHPFADGNGRTSRAVMNRILLAYDAPPINYHREDRSAYFEALNEYYYQDSLDGFVLFSEVQLLKTWGPVLLREGIVSSNDIGLAMGSVKELGMSLEEWIATNPDKCALPENRQEARQGENGHKGPRI